MVENDGWACFGAGDFEAHIAQREAVDIAGVECVSGKNTRSVVLTDYFRHVTDGGFLRSTAAGKCDLHVAEADIFNHAADGIQPDAGFDFTRVVFACEGHVSERYGHRDDGVNAAEGNVAANAWRPR